VLYPNISSADIRGTTNRVHAYYRHTGFEEVEVPIFLDDRHMKVVRLLVLRTDRLYPTEKIPGTHFYYRLSRPEGHSAGGNFMSKKNSNDTIGSGDIIFDLIWIQRSVNIYVKLKLEYQHEVIRTIYQRITRTIYTSLYSTIFVVFITTSSCQQAYRYLQ